MKLNKQICSVFLLVFVSCIGLTLNVAGQTYHEGDINCLKAFKANNDPTNMLGWDFESPGNLSKVTWSDSEPKRVIKLQVGGIVVAQSYSWGGKLSGNVNLTALTELEEFGCSSNSGITGLNLSGLKKLKSVYCMYCKITDLNITGCDNIEILNCEQNVLQSLDIEHLSILKNLDCQQNRIAELKIDNLTQLEKLVCNVNRLSNLKVEGLVNLKTLNCASNELEKLNVSPLQKLESLNCNNNKISVLDVEGLSELKFLYCSNNQLSTLNVGNLFNLMYLDCYNNQLKELNVSNLTNLKVLDCSENELESLDVRNLSKLQAFACSDNKISHLELNENAKELLSFYCENNNLLFNDLYHCALILWKNIFPYYPRTNVMVSGACELYGQTVDCPTRLSVGDKLDFSSEQYVDGEPTFFEVKREGDVSEFPGSFEVIDGVVVFHKPGIYKVIMRNNKLEWSTVTVETPFITVLASSGIDLLKTAKIKIYPNPAADVLNIESELQIMNINVFDIAGKIKYSGTESEIHLSDWNPGAYLIKLKTAEGTSIHKFLKK